MAFRIHQAVIRGEITNEVPGIVTGRIWLVGRSQPIVVQLQGNCMRDLAGCALTFRNPNPGPQHLDGLDTVQEGRVGQMTASRKAHLPTVTEEEYVHLIQEDGQIPMRFANCLYLEWFSRTNGRVVLESESCRLHISEPRWYLPSPDASIPNLDPLFLGEDDEDLDMAGEARAHEAGDVDPVAPLTGDDDAWSEGPDFGDPTAFGDREWEEDEDDVPLDEFEWEQELRDADQRADSYQEALERYSEHLDRREIFRRYLGLDTDETEGLPEPLLDAVAESEEPMEEAEAGLHHFLAERALDIAFAVQSRAEAHGLLGADRLAANSREAEAADPLYDLVASTVQVGGKLSAALDGVAQGFEVEPGFLIAMLKRSLVPLNEALDGCQRALSEFESRCDVSIWLHEARSHLFELRREILDLMEDLRASGD